MLDWYTVGLKLNLPTWRLDEVKSRPRGEQKKELLHCWKEYLQEEEQGLPSWKTLLGIFKELKMARVIQEIESRYSKQCRKILLGQTDK